jgi:hypothetical protein
MIALRRQKYVVRGIVYKGPVLRVGRYVIYHDALLELGLVVVVVISGLLWLVLDYFFDSC